MQSLLVFIPDRLTPPTPDELTSLGLGFLNESKLDFTWKPAFCSPLDGSLGIVCNVFQDDEPEILSPALQWYHAIGWQFACDPSTLLGGSLFHGLEAKE